MSGVDDWETWWDGASDEERAEFIDGSVDIAPTETFRLIRTVRVLPWWAADIGARGSSQPAHITR